jgi:hypothetical protein
MSQVCPDLIALSQVVCLAGTYTVGQSEGGAQSTAQQAGAQVIGAGGSTAGPGKDQAFGCGPNAYAGLIKYTSCATGIGSDGGLGLVDIAYTLAASIALGLSRRAQEAVSAEDGRL